MFAIVVFLPAMGRSFRLSLMPWMEACLLNTWSAVFQVSRFRCPARVLKRFSGQKINPHLRLVCILCSIFINACIVKIMHGCDHVICDFTLLRFLKINGFILYYQRYLATYLFQGFFNFVLYCGFISISWAPVFWTSLMSRSTKIKCPLK